jgi:hypothetical protein
VLRGRAEVRRFLAGLPRASATREAETSLAL